MFFKTLGNLFFFNLKNKNYEIHLYKFGNCFTFKLIKNLEKSKLIKNTLRCIASTRVSIPGPGTMKKF